MKKYLVLLLLFISTTCLYAVDIVPKVSLCLPGTFKSDYEVDIAANIGAEGRIFFSDYFAVAVGFDYLTNRNISMGKKASDDHDFDKGRYNQVRFSMLPVYAGIICYPFGNFGEYKPYLRIDGGYNVYVHLSNDQSTSLGYYVSGGFGFELYDRYIFELCAARYEATDNDNDDDNISYKNILFKFGYKFTI